MCERCACAGRRALTEQVREDNRARAAAEEEAAAVAEAVRATERKLASFRGDWQARTPSPGRTRTRRLRTAAHAARASSGNLASASPAAGQERG